MRIFIKIILTILVVFMTTAIAQATGGHHFTFVAVLAIIGIWAYKPKKNTNDTDLDKTV